jgi:hypothetical protein
MPHNENSQNMARIFFNYITFKRLLCFDLLLFLLVFLTNFYQTRHLYSGVFPMTTESVTFGSVIDGTAVVDTSHVLPPGYGGGFVDQLLPPLSAGVYTVTLRYEATVDGNPFRIVSDLGAADLLTTPIPLSSVQKQATLYMELKRASRDVHVQVQYYTGGNLRVTGIKVTQTGRLYKRGYFYALVICFLMHMIYRFYQSKKGKKAVIAGLAFLVLLSSAPLITLWNGSDLSLQLFRIESLYARLTNRTLSPMFYQVFPSSHGESLLMGSWLRNLIYLFPAILRILGFTIQDAYQYFVVIINLLTSCIAYHFFRLIFKSKVGGLIGSYLFVLSPFRLLCLFTYGSALKLTMTLILPPFTYCLFVASCNKKMRFSAVIQILSIAMLLLFAPYPWMYVSVALIFWIEALRLFLHQYGSPTIRNLVWILGISLIVAGYNWYLFGRESETTQYRIQETYELIQDASEQKGEQ